MSVRFLPIFWVFLFCLAGSSNSYAQRTNSGTATRGEPIARVAVLDILGSTDARSDLTAFQASIERAGLEVVQYAQLVRLIRALGMSPDDTSRPTSIRKLSGPLNIDYFIVVDYLKPTRLKVTVIEGDSGRNFWAKAFRISERGLTTDQWDELARRVADQLPQSRQLVQTQTQPQVQTQTRPQVQERPGVDGVMASVYGGFLGRMPE